MKFPQLCQILEWEGDHLKIRVLIAFGVTEISKIQKKEQRRGRTSSSSYYGVELILCAWISDSLSCIEGGCLNHIDTKAPLIV